VALITVDEEAVRKALGPAGHNKDLATMVMLPETKALLQAAVDEKNAGMPSYETVKYFDLLPRDFEVGDELTPTLKVKRRTVLEKYGDRIDALYSAHGD
jgi:long-chain acyl-CoA synthetase